MAKVAKHPWLTQRNGVYYLRAPVPQDIRDTYGRAEVTYSLKTKDRRKAERLIHAKANEVAAAFEDHRRKNVVSAPAVVPQSLPLDPLTIQRLCDLHYQRVIDQDFSWRSDVLAKMRADPQGWRDGKYIEHPKTDWYTEFFTDLAPEDALIACFRGVLKARLEILERALLVGEKSEGEAAADEALNSISFSASEADRLNLVRRLIETKAAALRAILAKDNKRYEEIASRHLPTAAQSGTSVAPSGVPHPTEPGPKLLTLVSKFLDERGLSGVVRTTLQSDQTDIREFVDVVGDHPIRHYTKAQGVKYKDTLLATPAQRKVKPFAGLTIKNAAERADAADPKRDKIARLHVNTINDKLMAVRNFFDWANRRLTGVPNPIEDLRIQTRKRRGRRSERRYPYRQDELHKIFNGPIYRGCKSDRFWKAPGQYVPVDSARYWAPLIGLFTGMRLGEIIQLRVSDIRKSSEGIRYFAVTTIIEDEDGEDNKSLKNANSERDIPIHPILFACGLQELIDKRRKNGEARLLMDYDRSPTDGSWSKTFSAWFRQYRKHVEVERIVGGKNRVDFHSFRHSFEDVVRDLPNVKQEVRDALQGHGESGISKVYGLGLKLERLNEAIQAVAYPGLDLTHLSRKAALASA